MNRDVLKKTGFSGLATGCNAPPQEFQPEGARRVEGAFDGGRITSDGGLLLLRELIKGSGILKPFAACFQDHRDPTRIEHSVEELLAQRVLGIVCGYEDLNDHDMLRDDPLLALAVGKQDTTGEARKRKRDQGHALAGKSTLNRFELGAATVAADERYKKISFDDQSMQRAFVDQFLQEHPEAPKEIVIDLDATDDPIHGNQEGRYFNAFYDEYCYLPLYTFCGHSLLGAALNTADKQPAAHAVEELERIIAQIQARWPEVSILVRGDSGFCREEIMRLCEDNGLFYVFGLQKNPRLIREIATEMEQAHAEFDKTHEAARVFKDFRYKTLDSWSVERRVVGKAEYTTDKENPRFVATNLPADRFDARALYEDVYCARGDMENRLKEQQLGLFADRTSSHWLRANQLRLWLSSIAYLIVEKFRRLALAGTELATAQVSTIRTRLLKVGALIKTSVRRFFVSLCSAFPLQHVWDRALENLRRHLALNC